MNKLLLLTFLTASSLTAFGESGGPTAFRRDPAPNPSNVAQSISWVADTRKMDEFLAKVDLTQVRAGSYHGETLPDTRVVWRDYAQEAKYFAVQNDQQTAQNRLGQMLKLAAIYRGFGGLQNVVQAEEIRALAGQTASQIGCANRIDSPYLERSLAECLAQVEQQIGAEKNALRPYVWQHLMESVRDSFARLSGQSASVVAEVERPTRTVSVVR